MFAGDFSHEANMKSILSMAICLGLLCSAGCRSDGNRELLERDLRDHEDQIYDLQNQVNDLNHQLEACHRENETLKKGSGTGDSSDSHEAAPRVTHPPAEIPEIPKINLGTPESTPAEPAPPSKRPGDSRDPSSAGAAAARPASLDADVPSAISRVAISRLMTGGHSFSGKPGDDGLLLVFAARDASGRSFRAEGEVSIVAIDPQAEGPAARLARWDFSAAEAAAHYRQGALANAFHFDLLWPDRAPEHSDLKLFVRLTTPDGRRFEDNLTVHVRLPGSPEATANWTKPEAPQHRAPATFPTGGQFDPDAEVRAANAAPPKRRQPQDDPPADQDSSGAEATPRTANRRPSWSPYR